MTYLRPSLALTAFFVVLTGMVFPGVVWGLAQALFPSRANGSLVQDSRGRIVGSALLGQGFTRPEYFHPRPSAAGAGYDAANSGGTNLGPTSSKLVRGANAALPPAIVDESFAGYTELARRYREENGLPPDALVPADAATRSASGLDPDISPANALLQVKRVARARGKAASDVAALVRRHTSGRLLGVLGEPRVNVLELNLALDAIR